MLTPDQVALIQWIQYNVFLDLAEHGIGNGIFDPFGGTATVTNGVVTNFMPSKPVQPFTPTTPPTPPPPVPMVDQNFPVCTPAGPTCAPQRGPLTTTGDDATNLLNFQLSGGSDQNGQTGFSYQFTDLSGLTHGTLTSNSTPVSTTTLYAPTTQFTFTPQGNPETSPTDIFKYQAVDNTTGATSPTQATVNITIPDSDTPT